MLSAISGLLGLLLQAGLFAIVYVLLSRSRGRALAALLAALAAIDGYALVLLGFMVVGVSWTAANVLLAVGLGAVCFMPSFRRRVRRRLGAALVLMRSHVGAISILGVIVLIQIVAVVLTPELSIDGQLYHGPVLAEMVSSGGIWGWDAPNQYMFYSDLAMVGALNLATFTGQAIFDNGAQIPHLLLLILAVFWALGRRFSSSWVRMAFAALFVSAPVIWIQPRILYVDVAYAAAVVTLIMLIVFNRRRGWPDLAFGAVAGASILAIKPAGILTSALLLGVFVVVAIWREVRSGRRWTPVLARAALMIAPAAILGLGFYIRNYFSFASPVFPVKVDMGPLHLPGIVDLSIFASGDRGSGLVDPLRLLTYAGNIATGVVDGMTKLDYDPRAGGFGHIPAVVLCLAVLLLVGQVILWRRRRGGREDWHPRGNLWSQLGIAALAVSVLAIQPATFDSRYVMGPTVALFTALVLSTVSLRRRGTLEVFAAALALIVAGGQIVWTEAHVYPGARTIADLRWLTAAWQPLGPGNPWGRGDAVAWLPDDSSCVEIAVQTSGGVTASGMNEMSLLAALPYALYGEHLCNTVTPVVLGQHEDAVGYHRDPIPTAQYLVLYAQDVTRWQRAYPFLADCWTTVSEVPGSGSFPQDMTVLRNSCR